MERLEYAEPGCCYICLWVLEDGAQKICYYSYLPDGQKPMVAPLPLHIKVTKHHFYMRTDTNNIEPLYSHPIYRLYAVSTYDVCVSR